jgi:hypothetical protein
MAAEAAAAVSRMTNDAKRPKTESLAENNALE